ncbi:MAG: response regulator [Myxococcota bacterium]|nr:response regulator [Myxococcota bacterium]
MPLDESENEAQRDNEREGRLDEAERFSRSSNLYALPVLVGLVILLVSLLAATTIRRSEDRALESAVDAALDSVTTEIEQGVDRQLYGLIVFAWKWDWQGGSIREKWGKEARQLIEDSPRLRGIVWLDQDHSILVGEPPEAGKFSIEGESRRREVLAALSRAEQDRRLVGVVTENSEGDKILLVHLVLSRQGVDRGYVIGSYGLESLLLGIFETGAGGFRVAITDEGSPLWASSPDSLPDVPHRSASASSFQMVWEVTVSPGASVVATYRTWLPFSIGLGGAFVGLLTALALFMGVDSRQKAGRMELVNQRLRKEMTLRDRAERARAETESELEETLNSLPVHVWSAMVTQEGEYKPRRMSAVLGQISGRPMEFFEDGSPGKWLQIVHPEDRERLAAIVDGVIAGIDEQADFEYRLLRPDGAIRYMSDSVRTTRLEAGRRLDGVSRDVTEMKHGEEERLLLEVRFQRAQRLESLGVLAGGIAHDFNNLLVAMLGHARLAENDLSPHSSVRQNLRSVVKAARQAAELCGQMLAYAGSVPLVTELIELEEVVQEMGDLLRASIPSSTFIQYSFDQGVPLVKGDASQIRQVALNLITNASEAIGERGGEITLVVECLHCDSEGLRAMEFSEDLVSGHFVALTVRDTGSGMDEATRKKIFEPFYTTKFTGRGLGLAAVVGIVRAHGGAVKIESELEKGSAISVLFPASEEVGVGSKPGAGTVTVGEWRGQGKILLVEDEESARELARIVLERAGLEVVEAADGLGALEIFGAAPDEFGCILLDLTMPNMDGVETYTKLREIRPEVRVVLCSGYPERAAMARFADVGLSGFLKKPYEPEELLKSLRPPEAQSLDPV